MLLPDLGVRRESTVFLSGIGCAARFPYYMNTYGMHSIHGRAPAIATGLATTRPDLDVWVVTGDGDALSIGGNHLIHALRRNVRHDDPHVQQPDLRADQGPVLADLRGGQGHQVDAVRLARHARSTRSAWRSGPRRRFVARTHDMDRAHMQEMFRRAHEHKGAAFVEVYQNCNVFNDGAFEKITGRDVRARRC